MGYSQVEGLHFDSADLFSPVVTLQYVRLLLAIYGPDADFSISHLDISQAFLWSKLDIPVYMKPFEGMKVPPGHVLKLLRGLYGLRNASSLWFKTIKKVLMEQLGYEQSQFSECVFVKRANGHVCIICLFVDDLLVKTT